jgi:hypothetical protein
MFLGAGAEARPEATGEPSTVRPPDAAVDDDLACGGDDRLSGAVRREVVVRCVDELG